MTLNHNVKVEIERINGTFIAQVEIAGVGKCTRTRTSYQTMEACLEGVAGHYLQGYAMLEAYARPAPAPESVTVQHEIVHDEMDQNAAALSGVPDILKGEPIPATIPEALAAGEKIDRRTKEGKRRFAAAPTP